MDQPSEQSRRSRRKLHEHLNLVPPPPIEDPAPAFRGHRSIGRLIAQTALIADTARASHDARRERPRGRFGWFV
jgi:hypothetical protein